MTQQLKPDLFCEALFCELSKRGVTSICLDDWQEDGVIAALSGVVERYFDEETDECREIQLMELYLCFGVSAGTGSYDAFMYLLQKVGRMGWSPPEGRICISGWQDFALHEGWEWEDLIDVSASAVLKILER